MVKKARKVGPYSRSKAVTKLDGRTREARLMQSVRTELTAHVGGNPSATQRGLIERAAQLSLRIAAMDWKFASSGVMTEHDSRTYLAWSGALSRSLRDLGLRPTAVPVRSLQDHLHARAAASAPC